MKFNSIPIVESITSSLLFAMHCYALVAVHLAETSIGARCF